MLNGHGLSSWIRRARKRGLRALRRHDVKRMPAVRAAAEKRPLDLIPP
ncbi:hypothetical protein SJ05684_c04140 [Sinorhizobium sojae CCBAU 05684]|uniref:Uncharacterized protein n=1 Tax=Sinorhizobium sojae CCBAU 05684 TaxID=716928 RepID=A0A249P7G2_9HYPH|nr:hypothetical protein SJ05684_c04140 [Sinorhizobium sojae CCBAU 05684]